MEEWGMTVLPLWPPLPAPLSICIFCSRVLISVMLHVIHVNGHGVVMISCTPWYRSCSIVKLIVCIIVSNV